MAPFASVNVVPAGHLSQRRGVASTTRVSGTGVDAECVVMKDILSDVATVLGRKQLQTNSRVHRGREDAVITARHTCTVPARDSIEQQHRQWHTPNSTVEPICLKSLCVRLGEWGVARRGGLKDPLSQIVQRSVATQPEQNVGQSIESDRTWQARSTYKAIEQVFKSMFAFQHVLLGITGYYRRS